ncbi:MAG: type II toxin-antitoxin system HicA family toxin [Candidatus Hydrogenedentes bacterium]|nr:type II toxin-antitoxin system HicA family toxin [Candidatus Hydrogenedentota bacterium]
MSKLPLCSSAQVEAVLKRLGFKEVKRGKGSHRPYAKVSKDGKVLATVLVLGKKEIPRGTLKSILELAGISPEEFIRHLK